MLLHLEDLEIYQLAMEIGEDVWSLVDEWPLFAKDTLGKQIVRSADSIALNIAEGYGRYHYKENKNFCYIARGSNMETKSAVKKAKNRKLVSEAILKSLLTKQERFHKMVNAYVKSIGNTKSKDQ